MSNDPFNDEPTQSPPESDFFSGGSPSCRFTNIGDTHGGTVVGFEVAQQRDIKTGEAKFWPDGKKCEMLVITLQTDERDPEIDDDDGERRLYVNKPSGMFVAIKTAIGKHKLVAGAKLAVKYVKNGKPTTPGFNPPKEYQAHYIPPATSQSPSVQPSAPSPSAIVMAARQKAWDAFVAPLEFKGKSEGERAAWRGLLASTVPGKKSSDFTISDWNRVLLAINEPVGAEVLDGPGIPEDDIPF